MSERQSARGDAQNAACVMTTESNESPPSRAQSRELQAADVRRKRLRWTRGLTGRTRRLTHSEQASLGWRIIAGGSQPGQARGLLRAWLGWERLAKRLWPVSEIPPLPYGLLSLRIARYRGEPVVLPDGTTVAPGATVGELHCNNQAILQLVGQRGNPFAACRKDLATLSQWVQRDAVGREINALYACTILTKAASRLGFTVREKPRTFRLRLEKFFFKGLLLLYSHEGLARIEHGSTVNNYPADIWLSRSELIARYQGRSETLSKPGACAPTEKQAGN
jgi:hypothetical protein